MTIVNQYPVMEVVMSPWLFVSLSCFACLSLFIAFLAAQERLWGFVISLTAFALVCGGLCAYGLSAKAESGRNRYECLIDDTTPFYRSG